MKDSWTIAIVTVVVLCFMVVLLMPYQELTFSGKNDFFPLYGGARLLDTGDLYNRERLNEEAIKAIGAFSDQHGYIRLPFHAAFLWPLSRLPYLSAYVIWEVAILAAFVAFVVFWRPPGGQLKVLLAAMSLPAFTSIANGQDCTFLLVFILGTVVLYRRGSKFWAGAVMSLCAIKFHLFLLVPVFIVARREWRLAGGLASGGAVLAAVSFAVAGWSWPAQFLESALNPAFSPRTNQMANLHGVMAQIPGGAVVEILIAAMVVATVWMVSRRMSFDYAFSLMLAAGFLLSIHAYLPDLVITLPAALTLTAISNRRLVKASAFLLLALPMHLAVLVGFPASTLVTAALMGLIGAAAVEAWRPPQADVSRA